GRGRGAVPRCGRGGGAGPEGAAAHHREGGGGPPGPRGAHRHGAMAGRERSRGSCRRRLQPPRLIAPLVRRASARASRVCGHTSVVWSPATEHSSEYASLMKFEEIEVGMVVSHPPVVLTREEMLAFARSYDPQPFHVDEAAAQGSRWGGLIGSGWLTCGLAMRMFYETALQGSEAFGSPGLERLR